MEICLFAPFHELSVQVTSICNQNGKHAVYTQSTCTENVLKVETACNFSIKGSIFIKIAIDCGCESRDVKN